MGLHSENLIAMPAKTWILTDVDNDIYQDRLTLSVQKTSAARPVDIA